MTDLEKHVNQPGRAKLVKRVREKINELGITYIYYQFISVTGRVVDQTIARSNGCQSLLSTLRGYGGHIGPVAGGVHSGGSGAGRSEIEGFGLAPYR